MVLLLPARPISPSFFNYFPTSHTLFTRLHHSLQEESSNTTGSNGTEAHSEGVSGTSSRRRRSGAGCSWRGGGSSAASLGGAGWERTGGGSAWDKGDDSDGGVHDSLVVLVAGSVHGHWGGWAVLARADAPK